ncbi:MAG: hypothetical protein K6G33_00050 [Ruminococcus sp.]|uniref:rolling circle replication-associated protein n=1 Tax=Ruminococcus sp. TaxID=41978 RepID=UPI0025D6D77D|nr:hypothetical protein [Ruminococcus sp.]MCR5599123.1 hypothetical protein [Ruminococcus sp.]
MQDLFNLVDFTPLQSGEVYKNSKTKLYTDGTTNTIVCRSSIFKDKYILTENQENEDVRKDKQIKADRKAFADKVDKVYTILERCGLMSYEFMNLTACDKDDDFLIKLNEIGMSIHEYDYCYNYFKKKVPQEKTKSSSEPRSDSVKRAKDQIFDYVLNNDFDYFFTGTIDPENFDSKDPKELLNPVQDWLKDRVKRDNMQYIMIAERHKKGGIHFHGLFKADKIKLEDSGTKLYQGHKKPISNDRAEKLGLYGGRTVYNLASWKFGFTTCVPLVGDRMNTAFYVTKYITKDCKKIFGKFFWHSRNLKKPLIIVADIDFDSIESADSNGFKYVFKRGEKNETV